MQAKLYGDLLDSGINIELMLDKTDMADKLLKLSKENKFSLDDKVRTSKYIAEEYCNDISVINYLEWFRCTLEKYFSNTTSQAAILSTIILLSPIVPEYLILNSIKEI